MYYIVLKVLLVALTLTKAHTHQLIHVNLYPFEHLHLHLHTCILQMFVVFSGNSCFNHDKSKLQLK